MPGKHSATGGYLSHRARHSSIAVDPRRRRAGCSAGSAGSGGSAGLGGSGARCSSVDCLVDVVTAGHHHASTGDRFACVWAPCSFSKLRETGEGRGWVSSCGEHARRRLVVLVGESRSGQAWVAIERPGLNGPWQQNGAQSRVRCSDWRH
jgi:hypothetical protein